MTYCVIRGKLYLQISSMKECVLLVVDVRYHTSVTPADLTFGTRFITTFPFIRVKGEVCVFSNGNAGTREEQRWVHRTKKPLLQASLPLSPSS